LNRELLIKSGAEDDSTKAQIREAEAAMAALEGAHAVVVEKLTTPGPPGPPDRG
jgi:hypothetical protein